MRFMDEETIDNRKDNNFQFSLWDSDETDITMSYGYSSFNSLYEILDTAAYYVRSYIEAFNSLYEIRSWGSNNNICYL